MNWSVYSKFVGNVFGAPLAIEGLAAFFLEATFLGVWIFGWNRLSPRLHLATLWIAVLGTWLSAYFILVANSFMQHPVGYKIVDGEAQLTSVWALLSSDWALLRVRAHDHGRADRRRRPSCSASAAGTSLRGRNVELFRPAAKLALIVLVPVACVEPLVRQPLRDPRHRAAADEDLRGRGAVGHLRAVRDSRSFQIGGFTESDQTPSFSIADPARALVGRDRLARRPGPGPHRAEPAVRGDVRERATTCRRCGRSTGACAVMVYAGSFVALVALVGAFLLLEAAARAAALVPVDRRRPRRSCRSSRSRPAGC